MDQQSSVLAIILNEADRDFYHQAAVSLGYPSANIIVGTPLDAADILRTAGYSPRYVIIDVCNRSYDALPELDRLAEYCDVETRVVVVGNTNDIGFYRALLDKGVVEYLTHPVTIDQIRSVLSKPSGDVSTAEGAVASFVGASAGDGSSTMALNVAYALASTTKKPTVLVDLDYQFGMVAKNLDIAFPYGIKEIFEHPDRGIDAMLMERMAVSYKGTMDLIVAPNVLQFLPQVPPELVRDFIHALREKYHYVILDLPHLWTHWISSTLTSSKHVVLTGQLWLKSVTHASRLLNLWKQFGISPQAVSLVINRSGAKFREGVNPKDFERVCGHKIDFYISNDIKTVVKAENQGTTLMELGPSTLANQIGQLGASLQDKLAVQKSGPVFRTPTNVLITHQNRKT